MALHGLGEGSPLVFVAVFKELLNDIVAKDVGHELEGAGDDLVKDKSTLLVGGRLELVLDETRAVLVAGELANVAVHVGKVHARVAALAELFETKTARGALV